VPLLILFGPRQRPFDVMNNFWSLSDLAPVPGECQPLAQTSAKTLVKTATPKAHAPYAETTGALPQRHSPVPVQYAAPHGPAAAISVCRPPLPKRWRPPRVRREPVRVNAYPVRKRRAAGAGHSRPASRYRGIATKLSCPGTKPGTPGTRGSAPGPTHSPIAERTSGAAAGIGLRRTGLSKRWGGLAMKCPINPFFSKPSFIPILVCQFL